MEATAPDGIVEAVRIEAAESFALAVQWHPEYRAPDNPDSVKLYSAFNAAVLARWRRKPQTQQSSRGMRYDVPALQAPKDA